MKKRRDQRPYAVFVMIVMFLLIAVSCGGLDAPAVQAPAETEAASGTASETASETAGTEEASDAVEEAAPLQMTVTQQPEAVSVQEGGSAVFHAQAENAASVEWFFRNQHDGVFSMDALKNQYPVVEIEGTGTETLTVKNLPAEFDGWTAFAVFAPDEAAANNYGSTATEEAAIGVSSLFAQLTGILEQSSGVGAWFDEMHLEEDGSFSAHLQDWDGASEYGDGSLSQMTVCDYSGKLGNVRQMDGYIYTVEVLSVSYDDTQEAHIEDDMWIVPTTPQLSEGMILTVYLPGCSTEYVEEDALIWTRILENATSDNVLNAFVLYEPQNSRGWVRTAA